MKAQDILKQNYPPSILIYGAAGTGKTALVSQLRGGYLFDFDGGMRTAAKLRDKFFEDRNAIEFDVYRDENPYKPKMCHEATAKMKNIVQACGSRKWKHDACIIDSLTGMCKASMTHEQAAQGDPFKKMEIQDWGKLVGDIEKMLTLLRSLHVLVVCTAHVDFLEKPKLNIKGKPIIGVTEITDVFPSSATKRHGMKNLAWLFDEVWIAEKKPAGGGKMNYRIDGEGDEIRIARSRSGLGKIVHNDIGMVGLLERMGFKYGGMSEQGLKDVDDGSIQAIMPGNKLT